jgi:hypothetical protein
MATLFPWLCIFTPMVVALQVFPGWKGPFSNTFGYIIARLAGGNEILLGMLKPRDGNQTIEYIYSDPSLLINQFSYDTFDENIKSSVIASIINTQNTDAFKRIIYLKDLVSEWIWYLLTASVAISTSASMISNSECTKSLDEYTASQAIALSQPEESKETPRVYTTTE